MNSSNNFFNKNKNLILFFMMIIIISLPGNVKCFDMEDFSSFILWLIVILFTLAGLGYWSRKNSGYEPIDNNIKSTSKL